MRYSDVCPKSSGTSRVVKMVESLAETSETIARIETGAKLT